MMEAVVLNLLRRQEDETANTGVDIQQLSQDNGDKQDAGKELLDLLQNPFKGSVRNIISNPNHLLRLTIE